MAGYNTMCSPLIAPPLGTVCHCVPFFKALICTHSPCSGSLKKPTQPTKDWGKREGEGGNRERGRRRWGRNPVIVLGLVGINSNQQWCLFCCEDIGHVVSGQGRWDKTVGCGSAAKRAGHRVSLHQVAARVKPKSQNVKDWDCDSVTVQCCTPEPAGWRCCCGWWWEELLLCCCKILKNPEHFHSLQPELSHLLWFLFKGQCMLSSPGKKF